MAEKIQPVSIKSVFGAEIHSRDVRDGSRQVCIEFTSASGKPLMPFGLSIRDARVLSLLLKDAADAEQRLRLDSEIDMYFTEA